MTIKPREWHLNKIRHCHCCYSLHHLISECVASKESFMCFNCGERASHKSANCPHPGKLFLFFHFYMLYLADCCHICHEVGHKKDDCPNVDNQPHWRKMAAAQKSGRKWIVQSSTGSVSYSSYGKLALLIIFFFLKYTFLSIITFSITFRFEQRAV